MKYGKTFRGEIWIHLNKKNYFESFEMQAFLILTEMSVVDCSVLRDRDLTLEFDMNVLKGIWAHFIKSHHHWEDLQNRLFDPDLGRPCQLLAKIKFTFQLCCQYNCTCQSIIMFYQIYKLNIIVKIEYHCKNWITYLHKS